MDYEPDGRHESLILSARERTALRTHHMLVAARLAFIFSHGALLMSASVSLGWAATSWWAVFAPAWLGNAICIVLVIYSWFASCPYVKLCLSEHQARLGDNNPSILTELFPEVIMAVLGFFFMLLVFAGEMLLCQYLDDDRHGHSANLVPSAVLFIMLSLCACCRGICIRNDGEFFTLLGAGAFATTVVALLLPAGYTGRSTWMLVLPPLVSVGGLIVISLQRLRQRRCLFTREERILRAVELCVILLVLVAFAVLLWALAIKDECGAAMALRGPAAGEGCGDANQVPRSTAASAGFVVGICVCLIAALRARMVIVESYAVRLDDVWQATPGWMPSGPTCA
mmetsp:Transcript_117982/g.333719  ORF Transcript_117982/g.333719 Transcript_117982/m.333719 type:complete len:341 (+) Transcript_117982:130-1152(+)